MNIKKRPALFFVLTAFTVIVCRCGGAMGSVNEPIRLPDGSIIASCEYFSDFSDSTEVNGTPVVVTKDLWECSVTCPDNSTVKFETNTKPPAVIAVAEKEAFLAQYCSAAAMIEAPAASETSTPTEEPVAADATATSTATAVPQEQVVIIPQTGLLILPPVLEGSISACDISQGFINFPLSSQVPDLTGRNVTVTLNGREVNCSVSGSQNQLLGCSLPAGTTFPIAVKVILDEVEVNSFSFDGATCTNTVPPNEKDPKDPKDPNDPAAPTEPPVDCGADPYNPACFP